MSRRLQHAGTAIFCRDVSRYREDFGTVFGPDLVRGCLQRGGAAGIHHQRHARPGEGLGAPAAQTLGRRADKRPFSPNSQIHYVFSNFIDWGLAFPPDLGNKVQLWSGFCHSEAVTFCLRGPGGRLMTMIQKQDNPTTQSLQVFRADSFSCSDGVAEGEALSFADELVMDDVYMLANGARRERLSLVLGDGPRSFTIGAKSGVGAAGRRVHLDSCLTLMAPDSTTCEILILVEVENGGVEDIYLLPLAPLTAETEYRLVGFDREIAARRFAEVACVSFCRGTHITMASGEQRRIEDLRVGDKVLTRDDGPQAIRWIGQTTVRAIGAFAPIVIRKGTLHNENDLWLSPDHRIFVYQRQDRLGAGRAEVLVKVRHLVNGTSVIQEDGGFMDYFQLLFDQHQIIYAEGIAAESLLIDQRTRPALPSGAADRGRHEYRAHLNYEVSERLLSSGDTVEKLRRASRSD